MPELRTGRVHRQSTTPTTREARGHGRTERTTPEVAHVAAPHAESPPALGGSTPGQRRTLDPITGGSTATTPSTNSTGHRPLHVRLEAGHGSKPMNQHELRAHVRMNGKLQQVSFEHALPSAPTKAPGVYGAVSAEAIDKAWKKALEVRAKHVELLLSNPDAIPSAPPVTPEDGSVRVAAYHMGFGAMDQAVERFIEQMADVGRVEGFRAVVRLHAGSEKYLRQMLGREEENNTTVVKIDTYHDIWSEDAAEVHRDRSIGVPPPMPNGMNPSAEILKARIERYCPGVAVPDTDDSAKLYAVLKEHAPEACYGVLGQVFARDAQLTFVGLALAAGKQVRANLCAVEGGNMLVGTGKDGSTHAFVGRDSFELSKRMLKREVGAARAAKVTDALVMTALAKDLGLPVEQIHVVEQPADYHLDVKMIPIAPGEVIVNDSVAATKREIEWAQTDHARKEPKPPRNPTTRANERYRLDREVWVDRGNDLQERIKSLEASAKRSAAGEARAQADLERAGFKVHRVAAVYPWGAMLPMSFLNAEQGRGKDGQRFYIALGGDVRGEKAFLQDLKAIGVDIARYYFLDRELTFNTLQAGGGINCRCKPEAAVA